MHSVLVDHEPSVFVVLDSLLIDVFIVCMRYLYVAWVRALHNGDMAVALLNTGTKTHDITVQLSDVVCARCVRVTPS